MYIKTGQEVVLWEGSVARGTGCQFSYERFFGYRCSFRSSTISSLLVPSVIIKETVRTRGVGRSENVGPGRRVNVLVLFSCGDRNCVLYRTCILDTADLISMDQPHLPWAHLGNVTFLHKGTSDEQHKIWHWKRNTQHIILKPEFYVTKDSLGMKSWEVRKSCLLSCLCDRERLLTEWV